MPRQPRITLIHVSDLHLEHPLTERGRRLLRAFGTKTHGYQLLSSAAEAVSRVTLATADTKQVLVASGDLTTAGNALSFGLARRVLEQSEVVEGEIGYPVGLNAGLPLWVVPGNHDRFDDNLFLRQHTHFEREFQDHLPAKNWPRYGPTPRSATSKAPRLPWARVITDPPARGKPGLAIVGIGLDSTQLRPAESKDPLGRIARGRVTDDSLAYLTNVCEAVRDHAKLIDSEGVTHDLSGHAVRFVAILHHHPYLPPDLKQSWLTRLANAQTVCAVLRKAGIDMAVFGHQHVTFCDAATLGADSSRPREVLFLAAGTLCQWDEDNGNSFNVYAFSDDRVIVETWRYGEGLFRPEAARTYPLLAAERL